MRRNERIKIYLSYLLIGLAVLFFVFPIFWLGLTSFKPPRELFSFGLPSQFTLENYLSVFRTYEMTAFLANSLVTSLSVTALAVGIGALGAYGFARYRFAGSGLLLVLVLVMRMIPSISLMIPLYLMFANLGLLNTRAAVIIAQLAFVLPLAIWILEGFFRSLPKELEEAALVDGCSRLGTFWRIVLPISAPGLAVTAIFAFLFSWNDFALPLVLTSTPASQTLPMALSQMSLLFGIRWDHMSAASMMYIVPTILIAALLSRFVVRGLTAGAVKG